MTLLKNRLFDKNNNNGLLTAQIFHAAKFIRHFNVENCTGTARAMNRPLCRGLYSQKQWQTDEEQGFNNY